MFNHLIFPIIVFIGLFLCSHSILNYIIKNPQNKILKTRKNFNDRWNVKPKPIFGGIAFYFSFLLASIISFYILDTNLSEKSTLLIIIFVVSLGFFTGLIDDIYNTVPWLKFVLQTLCGLILALNGISINFFDSSVLNIILTVFWVVAIMNATNLLDNMDGISGIVSTIILCGFLVASLTLNSMPKIYTPILVGVIASLICFLKFNFHPSKVLMGDTGSMFLGVILAIFGILFLWNYEISSSITSSQLIKIIIIVSFFLLLITDTTTVFFKRIFIFKKSPFIGGKDHTTHHLSYIGMTEKQIFAFFSLIKLITVSLGILLLYFSEHINLIVLIFSISILFIIFISLFIITHRNLKKNET